MGTKQKQKQRQEYIQFDFVSYQYLWKSVCIKEEFTNMLKNCDDFCEQHKQYQKFVDHFRNRTIQDVQNKPHCHSVEGKRELELIKKIIKAQYDTRDEIFEKNWGQRFEGERFFQFGLTRGFRVVGTLNGNEFHAIIFDYHHQIYQDEKHNNNDIKNNDFQPYYEEGNK